MSADGNIKNVIVTGAGGLVGSLLAKRLLNDGYQVIMTDIVQPTVPEGTNWPENAVCMQGDICDSSFLNSFVEAAQPLQAVFLLHGMMSADSEADFDQSTKVNVESVRSILLLLRQTNPGVRVIYSSSQAVYGQPLPAVVTDDVTPTPEGTYGSQKLSTETLLNDMHRRGFVDAFIVRFPTLVVRPGKSSKEASSFLSGMIREPMNGETCVIPLRDRNFKSYICSSSSVIENLVRVLNMQSDVLPKHIRHINFPGVSSSTQALIEGLAKYGGSDKLKYLKEETDPAMERILRSWPQDFDPSTPDRLGLVRDKNPDDLVKEVFPSGLVLGHPEVFFEISLCWGARKNLRRRKVSKAYTGDPVRNRLPSWSWMGWQGQVHFPDDHEFISFGLTIDRAFTRAVAKWHALSTPDSTKKHLIGSTWHWYREGMPDTPLEGWRRKEFMPPLEWRPNPFHPQEISFNPIFMPKDLPAHGYIPTMKEDSPYISSWYLIPVGNSDLASEDEASDSHREFQYLQCLTTRAYLYGSPDKVRYLHLGSNALIQDDCGNRVGGLRVHHEDDQTFLANGPKVELIAVAKGWTTELKEYEQDAIREQNAQRKRPLTRDTNNDNDDELRYAGARGRNDESLC
ncbi:nucleoside-diphosphate-sugar epimerase [Apiospora arundinis]|uniref:Nucleoside-diphosphate-sugar epimerase n=1 Tax=Apiospora arundinis TaxID=335852 RepID=A0ABR2IVX4_9PEZI